ncbi:MAG: hypothetical protein ACREQ5_12970 [Candidatus Dormibacteria bacterium]
MNNRVTVSVAFATMLGVSGCGGGGPQGVPPGGGTTVTVSLAGGAPTSAVVAIGNSTTFAPTTVQGNKVSFVVPPGSSNYALAVACPPASGGVGNTELVIEANFSDGVSYGSLGCSGIPLGTATGSFDVTQIPGATSASVAGAFGTDAPLSGTSGPFSAQLATGTNDVAIIANDANNIPLAVKFARGQSVPGTINGNAPIILTPADHLGSAPVTVNALPAGYTAFPGLIATFQTANGTLISLPAENPPSYRVLAAVDTAAGDSYAFSSVASSSGPVPNAFVVATQYAPLAGAVTLNYPMPWSYAGPAPAAFPTFNFAYAGFPGVSKLTYQAQLAWQASANTTDTINVFATPGYLGSLTSIAMPNLAAVPGFFASAPAGAKVGWTGLIFGGSVQAFVYPPPVSGLRSIVQVSGNYIEP